MPVVGRRDGDEPRQFRAAGAGRDALGDAGPASYPADKFEEAWNNVLLYSEHTWGAHCSISQPASPFTIDQWNIKQSYATVANLQSRQLLSEAAQNGAGFQPRKLSRAADPAAKSTFGGHLQHDVLAADGGCLAAARSVRCGEFRDRRPGSARPAQRLASDELAVLVRDLPPLAGRRYTIAAQGTAAAEGQATAAGTTLANDKLRIRLDEKTGGDRSNCGPRASTSIWPTRRAAMRSTTTCTCWATT